MQASNAVAVRPCAAPQVAAADVLLLAAAVEANSEHPLGSAIVAFAQASQQQKQQKQQANDGANGARGGVQLPACRDVAVAVGQGISAWVQLPAAAVPANGDGTGGAAPQSWHALAQLQAEAGAAVAPAEGEAPGEVRVAVGSKRLMAAAGLPLPEPAEAYMQGQQELGRTCVLVAVGGAVVAAVAIQDPVKPEAA